MCIHCFSLDDWSADAEKERDRMTVRGIAELEKASSFPRRLVRDLVAMANYEVMTNEQLVEAALNEIQSEDLSNEFEHLVQELMSRVDPGWARRVK